LSTFDIRSPVSAGRLAEATCTPCHDSLALTERYELPGERLRSYVDSYHGLKRKAGKIQVANCASCHGHHLVLPHTDPRSSIHPDNLRNTCAECHPRISAVLAGTSIHESATGAKTGWARFVAVFYMWFIALTIGAMVLHNIGHWFRHVRRRAEQAYVVRLTPAETAQHWVLMISFIVLVLTGFSLRFSEAWWSKLLFGWGGGAGFLVRGTIHRVVAVAFMLWAAWHVCYLCTARGRAFLADMIGSRRDLHLIGHSALFFLGRTRDEPSFGRFSYMEKCEYWAVVWGAVIMTVTGVLLWFDDYFIETWQLPKGFLDVMLVIHYYEAWLASLAILVWHIYGTVFSPTVYPMNPAWLIGRMPSGMYSHEHPSGPGLTVHAPQRDEANMQRD
jgi:cytochrome b subunit of formate dehydrogenase